MFKSKLYATVALLALLALIGTACVQEAPAPTPPAEPEANFRFLISDEANAIDDFEHLYVTISNIGFQQGGESGSWTEFAPNVTEVDLRPLVEEKALVIWSGNLTPGDYTKVFIYASDVEGILKGTSDNETDNKTENVKLPSGKLQISKPFTVSEDGVTSFVYDITVVEAGQSGQYILKPQIDESGADKEFKEVKQEQEREREEERERERENEEESEFEGTIEAIDGTMWTVLISGDNWTAKVSGAEIEGEPDIGRLVEIKGTEEDSVIQASEVEIKEAEEPGEDEDADESEGNGGGGAGLGISCNEFAEKKHIEEDIDVDAGEEFQITLCSNHTTGFQWSEARIGDETLVEEVSHEFVPPNGQTVGAAGKEVWTFKALKEGRTTISMEYSQPWEGGTKAEWTFELTVEVE